MAAPAKHVHSIHIDAPVEKVFHYIEDPAHFVSAMPKENDMVLGAVTTTPEGTVASYEGKFRQLGMHLTATFTREQYVANEKIVDHSSLGPVFTFTVAPDDGGTSLSLGWDASRLMTMLDAAFFHGDKAIEEGLTDLKQEVEALS